MVDGDNLSCNFWNGGNRKVRWKSEGESCIEIAKLPVSKTSQYMQGPLSDP